MSILLIDDLFIYLWVLDGVHYIIDKDEGEKRARYGALNDSWGRQISTSTFPENFTKNSQAMPAANDRSCRKLCWNRYRWRRPDHLHQMFGPGHRRPWVILTTVNMANGKWCIRDQSARQTYSQESCWQSRLLLRGGRARMGQLQSADGKQRLERRFLYSVVNPWWWEYCLWNPSA